MLDSIYSGIKFTCCSRFLQFTDSERSLQIFTDSSGSPALVQAFGQELDLEHPRVKILQCSRDYLVVQVQCLKFFKDLSAIFPVIFQSLNVNTLKTQRASTVHTKFETESVREIFMLRNRKF